MKPIINKRAGFHYQFLESWEAGIVLEGREVKSVKKNRCNISAAYVSIAKDEAFLFNASISLYEHAAPDLKYDPERPKKLLLKKAEIQSLKGKIQKKGLTLIVGKVYTNRGRVKVEVVLAKGKSQFDKRESILKREALRKIQNRFKQNLREC
jgi:SsrA-binding protein